MELVIESWWMCLVLWSTSSWRRDLSVSDHISLQAQGFHACNSRIENGFWSICVSHFILSLWCLLLLSSSSSRLIRFQKCLPVFSSKNKKGDGTFLEVIATLLLSLSVIPSLHPIFSLSSMKRSVRKTERNDSASFSCSSSSWCSCMFLHAFCSKWVCTVLSSSFQQIQQILNHTSLMLYCSWRLDKRNEGSSCVHTRPSVLKSLSLFKLLFLFFFLYSQDNTCRWESRQTVKVNNEECAFTSCVFFLLFFVVLVLLFLTFCCRLWDRQPSYFFFKEWKRPNIFRKNPFDSIARGNNNNILRKKTM